MNSSSASDPAASPFTKEGNRRGRFFLTPRRWAALWMVAAVASASAAAWWWHATTRPDYLLRRGREALGTGDAEQVWPWIDTLVLRGHDDEAALLQGALPFLPRRVPEDAPME